MSSWSTRVWDAWLRNVTSYHDSDTFVEPISNCRFGCGNRSMNRTTKKIRECGAKETQLSLILVIIASCLIFARNICEFFLYEKLIEMRGDYVLICNGNKSLIPLAY